MHACCDNNNSANKRSIQYCSNMVRTLIANTQPKIASYICTQVAYTELYKWIIANPVLQLAKLEVHTLIIKQKGWFKSLTNKTSQVDIPSNTLTHNFSYTYVVNVNIIIYERAHMIYKNAVCMGTRNKMCNIALKTHKHTLWKSVLN